MVSILTVLDNWGLFFFCFGFASLKYLLLTGQEHKGSDSADISLPTLKRPSRPSCLQLQAQANFVTTGIDVLPVHQCREDEFHTRPESLGVSNSYQAGIIHLS